MKYEESDSLFINFFRVISFLFSFFDTFFFFLMVGDGGGGRDLLVVAVAHFTFFVCTYCSAYICVVIVLSSLW